MVMAGAGVWSLCITCLASGLSGVMSVSTNYSLSPVISLRPPALSGSQWLTAAVKWTRAMLAPGEAEPTDWEPGSLNPELLSQHGMVRTLLDIR